ncbi:MAG: hypothetical protein AB2385_15575 [Symbiobacterium sp.]|jgi:hypothetical protein|uniref:hypothetical protein n=1 Tax=Symbiobacterium sp. TaxID=1971213 RepID=UPI003463E845
MPTHTGQGSGGTREGAGGPRKKALVEDWLLGLALIALMLSWGGFGGFWFWVALALGAAGGGLKVWRQRRPDGGAAGE